MNAEDPVTRATMDDELARTLGAAAELAPAPEPDFYAAVRDRQRRIVRRRTTATGVSAVAAVLVLSAAALVLRPSGDAAFDAPPVANGPAASTPADRPPLPAERAKEGTVGNKPLKLPPSLAGGQHYLPAGTINGVVVVQPLVGNDRGVPMLIDAGTAEKRATLGDADSVEKFAYQPVVWGGAGIGWYAHNRSFDAEPYARLWYAPYTDFAAVQVAEVRGAKALITGFAVGSRYLWWSTESGAVYRMPLTAGSEPVEVPAARGATVVGHDYAVRTADVQNGIAGGTQIVDLTGTDPDRRLPSAFDNGAGPLRCGLWLCVANDGANGALASDYEGKLYSLGVPLEQVTIVSGGVIGRGPDGWLLWDIGANAWFRLSTGEIKGMWNHPEPGNLTRPYVWWTEPDGSRRLWDLTKG
ncbi:hypothetical protein Val02_83750 [Virgisporangium aliadipatigenens]|uniref:Uncharacterized protein n=1 Tax=Virgisporangium aliadipatigenens TaxID=741659 RepID=A0A8J4DV63_9ACTN|nr:hypothetical protein [Virgisporangium aliadipatigenens]GIJ51489.1 hypothetical protein Val02_83750 [Virgisporangium aliadipatigenens]